MHAFSTTTTKKLHRLCRSTTSDVYFTIPKTISEPKKDLCGDLEPCKLCSPPVSTTPSSNDVNVFRDEILRYLMRSTQTILSLSGTSETAQDDIGGDERGNLQHTMTALVLLQHNAQNICSYNKQ